MLTAPVRQLPVAVLLAEEDVAAISKPKPAAPIAGQSNRQASPSLLALTSAALALPGLIMSSAHADIDGGQLSFQYGRYREGGATKSLFRQKNNNIQVDSLHAFGEIDLSDRLTFRGNFIQDTWAGATPITAAPAAVTRFNPNVQTGASAFTNTRGGLVDFDTKTGQGLALIPGTFNSVVTGEIVHVMAQASPETRKQGDFGLKYEWNEATLEVGGGLSQERDFESQYFRLGGNWDFNQKLTTLTWGVNYTNNTINVLRYPFRVTSVPVDTNATPNPNYPDWSVRVNSKRTDSSINFGLTQVLDKNSLLSASFVYTHNSGYLSDPYKESVFLVPLDMPGTAWAYDRYDTRPSERNQFTWNADYSRYLTKLNAALKFNYSFFHDTWGINAHTFGASWGQSLGHGWTITPSVRYYSQSAADFYSPYFIASQTPLSLTEVLAHQSTLPTPEFFTSDQRLSAFGALSGGVTVSKQFIKGVTLEAGFEYYQHAGALKLGGGGTGNFADFNYFLASGLLKVDLSALGHPGDHYESHHHSGNHSYSGHHVPAGIMYSHMLNRPGEFMVGYRYMHESQVGDMLHGTQAVNDLAVVHNGCNGNPCGARANYMDMNMHMLDIMYAPTSWLNLMLMPQFMDMNMSMRPLAGAPPPSPNANGGHSMHMSNGLIPEGTGGVGDTKLLTLIRLFDSPFQVVASPMHHLHMALGVSAPTGDAGVRMQGQGTDPNSPYYGKPLFLHYGMQLGSGTWDFLPSLTYTGVMDRWSWGGQLNGTVRMESKNSFGYALGNVFQATAWGDYSLLNWLSGSVRGIYTAQGAIRGQFNESPQTSNTMPMDWPNNYGGRFWDVGFGLNAFVPSGKLKGNLLSIEWVQPVQEDVNGFQLERKGSLFVTWGFAF
jgi:hypothetical protein